MELSIEKVHDIPLSEVSGLGRRRTPDGVQQVLAVGDRQFDVIMAHQDGEASWRFDRVPLEFGKHGDHAEGVQPSLLFDSLGEYPMPPDPTTTFELMATWSLDEASGITDISDMAEAPDGRLYLLSDESRCIARVRAATAGGPELSIEEIWELPEELKQPEGLIIMDDMVPLVAIDRDEQVKNLFVMQPLD